MSADDPKMHERNQVVALLAKLLPATRCRTDIPDWKPDWHWCIYIDTPAGQLSWHVHDSQIELFEHVPVKDTKWDGHDTDEKYRRARELTTIFDGWELHPQGCYALWRFCNRLDSEGYLKDSRKKDLLERAANSRDGHGFLTNKERTALNTQKEVEDLLS